MPTNLFLMKLPLSIFFSLSIHLSTRQLGSHRRLMPMALSPASSPLASTPPRTSVLADSSSIRPANLHPRPAPLGPVDSPCLHHAFMHGGTDVRAAGRRGGAGWGGGLRGAHRREPSTACSMLAWELVGKIQVVIGWLKDG